MRRYVILVNALEWERFEPERFLIHASQGLHMIWRMLALSIALLSSCTTSAADETSFTKTLNKRYLLFPIHPYAPVVRVTLQIDGQLVREFDAELGVANDATLMAPLDITAFHGKNATLTLGNDQAGFNRVVETDKLPPMPDLYNEALRPQFHFSQRVGWNNDPNGLVYHDGEWHLYFQHNPYGWNWGNMHWGHAVSPDLVHWKQLPIAIYNRKHGDWAFSGSAVVDEQNTAGWQQGNDKVIVAAYTSTGRGECLAYSRDRGRTFVEYEGNPVVRHKGRDPKLIWHEPTRHWVMAVYDEEGEDTRAIAFYTSPDLKQWTLASKLPGYFECPEIFALPVDGVHNNIRWVVFAADAKYAIGKFDGRAFTPDHDGKHQLHHGAYYASQTFSNAPDGRRIQIGWAKIDMPNMPFNQTFSFPHQLTLRTTPDGTRLFAEPIQEIVLLHKAKHVLEDKQLISDRPTELDVAGALFDIRASFEIGSATEVGLDIGGNPVTYDVAANKLNSAELNPIDGKLSMQILVDRPMIEISGNAGRVVITSPRRKLGDVRRITAFAKGGDARLLNLEVHELKSIWDTKD
jgi:fructan beta-fructosidase